MDFDTNILKNHKVYVDVLFPCGYDKIDFIARSRVYDYSSFWANFSREEGAFMNNVFPKSPVVVGFAPFVSFSSFSPALCDGYSHSRHKRPFQLHMLPGARFCDRKGGGDIMGAMWLPDEFRKQSVVTIWDAWTATTLFEIFYECIEPITNTPDQFRVYDVKRGEYITDVRDPEHLARRPVVPDATLEKAHKACPMTFWINRFKELSVWSKKGLDFLLVPPANEDQRVTNFAYRQANGMYSGVFGKEPYSNKDMLKRFDIYRHAHHRGLNFKNLASRATASPVLIEDSPEQAHWRKFRTPLRASDWSVVDPLFMRV